MNYSLIRYSVESNLASLFTEAENELKALLIIIMKESEAVQKYIWNSVYHFDEAALEALYSRTLEAEHTYSIDDSFELYCGLMETIEKESR